MEFIPKSHQATTEETPITDYESDDVNIKEVSVKTPESEIEPLTEEDKVFIKESFRIENNALSQETDETGEKQPQKTLLKKACTLATAAAIALTITTSAWAKEKGQGPEKTTTIEETRASVLENYLRAFKVEGLHLGKPHTLVRCPCEQHGIYIKDKDSGKDTHLGDIHSHLWKFTEDEFKVKIEKVLSGQEGEGVILDSDVKAEDLKDLKTKMEKEKLEKPKFKINIQPEAEKILKNWGGEIKGKVIYFGDPTEKLELDQTTKSVEIKIFGLDTIIIFVENIDGSKDIAILDNGKVVDIKTIPARTAEAKNNLK